MEHEQEAAYQLRANVVSSTALQPIPFVNGAWAASEKWVGEQ
jgi:hypothetical protein